MLLFKASQMQLINIMLRPSSTYSASFRPHSLILIPVRNLIPAPLRLQILQHLRRRLARRDLVQGRLPLRFPLRHQHLQRHLLRLTRRDPLTSCHNEA